ncbi:MAG: hypothetical protein ACXWQO_13910 [Bdellovibrionota bacterium]
MYQRLSRPPLGSLFLCLLFTALGLYLWRDASHIDRFHHLVGFATMIWWPAYAWHEFRWLGWDANSKSFVVNRLFRPSFKVPLGAVEDLREVTYGPGRFAPRILRMLRRGETKDFAVTGGNWAGFDLPGILALPGIREEFERRMHSGETFWVTGRELRIEGDKLFVKDGNIQPEAGAAISSMRVTLPGFGERFLHYSDFNSLSLGRFGDRSIWQLLLLKLPFQR